MKTSRSGWEWISQAAVADSDRLWETDSVIVITLLIYFRAHVETLCGSIFFVLFMCLSDRISVLFSAFMLC